MGKNLRPKIIDFGLSIITSKNKAIKELNGTPEYIAPELLIASKKGEHIPYQSPSDMYAFGITLFEMANLKSAYCNASPTTVFTLVLKGERPFISRNRHPKITSMIQSLWAADPSTRPEAKDLAVQLKDIRDAMFVK